VNRLAGGDEHAILLDGQRLIGFEIDVPGFRAVGKPMGEDDTRLQREENVVAADRWRSRRACGDRDGPPRFARKRARGPLRSARLRAGIGAGGRKERQHEEGSKKTGAEGKHTL
jgi:hypothetical protein